MKHLVTLVALLPLLTSTSAFAAECDRNDVAVNWFRNNTGGECEYAGDERFKLMWICRNPRLSPLYFRFFSEDDEHWPSALTQVNVCFSDTDRCVIWQEGHCTCDECVIDAVLE